MQGLKIRIELKKGYQFIFIFFLAYWIRLAVFFSFISKHTFFSTWCFWLLPKIKGDFYEKFRKFCNISKNGTIFGTFLTFISKKCQMWHYSFVTMQFICIFTKNSAICQKMKYFWHFFWHIFLHKSKNVPKSVKYGSLANSCEKMIKFPNYRSVFPCISQLYPRHLRLGK